MANTVEVTTVLYSVYSQSKVKLCCHSLFFLKSHEYLICFDFEILFSAASSIFYLIHDVYDIKRKYLYYTFNQEMMIALKKENKTHASN